MSSRADPAPHWWVICLCAEWCGVCREWRDTFDEARAAHPQLRFAWVDVEDEADAMGDVDIETFPTVLIARDGDPVFMGPVLPSGAQLTRLIASLIESPEKRPGISAQAAALLQRLAFVLLKP